MTLLSLVTEEEEEGGEIAIVSGIATRWNDGCCGTMIMEEDIMARVKRKRG